MKTRDADTIQAEKMKNAFDYLVEEIDKKIGQFVETYLVKDGAIDPESAEEIQIYEKLTSIGEILNLI